MTSTVAAVACAVLPKQPQAASTPNDDNGGSCSGSGGYSTKKDAGPIVCAAVCPNDDYDYRGPAADTDPRCDPPTTVDSRWRWGCSAHQSSPALHTPPIMTAVVVTGTPPMQP